MCCDSLVRSLARSCQRILSVPSDFSSQIYISVCIILLMPDNSFDLICFPLIFNPFQYNSLYHLLKFFFLSLFLKRIRLLNCIYKLFWFSVLPHLTHYILLGIKIFSGNKNYGMRVCVPSYARGTLFDIPLLLVSSNDY